MGQFRQDDGSVAQWFADRASRALISGLLHLPYPLRLSAMALLMRRIVAPLAGYRRRAMAHLAHVHPDMSLSAKRLIAEAVADNVGRTFIENYSGGDFAKRIAKMPVTGPGLAQIEKAKRDGRPVLFVTGHIGNHEAPRVALVGRGFAIGGLYRPMANPFFNAHYAATMTRISGPVFAQGRRGTTGFARHLKRGGMGTLLFDIWDRGGAVVPFLGQPAPTSLSAAELALRFDALLVPYFGLRRPDGVSFDIVIEEPIPHGDPVAMTREMTARLEARIADDPGQWFWFHRRWKPHRRLS